MCQQKRVISTTDIQVAGNKSALSIERCVRGRELAIFIKTYPLMLSVSVTKTGNHQTKNIGLNRLSRKL
jgi:hypothetical protein